MPSDAAVTVVVTTRNRCDLLRRTLGSVLAQVGDAELDVIVIDEGSSDGTSRYLETVTDPRLTVVRNDEPLGLSEARNQGISLARGRYVAICDDDDVWAPTKVESQLRALAEAQDARWALAGTIVLDEDDRVIDFRDLEGGPVLEALLRTNVTPSISSLLAERSLLHQVGGFDPSLPASEDWDMEIRLAVVSPVAVAHGPLVAYRAASRSMSSDTDLMRASAVCIKDRYAELAEAHGVTFDDAAYEHYLARQALRAGRRVDAAHAYLRVARSRPTWRALLRPMLALVAPGMLDRKAARATRAAVPEKWAREFEGWWAHVPKVSRAGHAPRPT